MKDIDMGMGFYVRGPGGWVEAGHVSGVLPIPRVGELVHVDGKLLGRVESVEYHYRHLDGPTDSTVVVGAKIMLDAL